MASRVNVRFVVMLAVSLGVLSAAVGGVAVWVTLKSGKRNIAMGDAAMAEGDYEAAERFYARGVNKEQSNVEWLEKWRAAMLKKIPETQTRYIADYQLYAGGILKSLAIAKRTDLAAHREYLDEFAKRVRYTAPSPRSWESLIGEVEQAIRYFQEPPGQLLRYRGQAIVALMALNTEVRSDRREQALQDLTRALEADPADGASAASLAMWHGIQAIETAGTPEVSAEHAALAMETIERFTAAHPTDPDGLLGLLRVKAMAVERNIPVGNVDAAAALRVRRAGYDAVRGDVERVAEALMTVDPSKIDALMALSFRSLATLLNPERADELATRLVDRLLEAHPNDADMLVVKATLAKDNGRNEEAIELFQRIVDMPMGPISFSGMRMFDLRAQAVSQQAEAAMALVNSAESGEARAKALERVKKYRSALAGLVPESSPPLMLLDAKIALSENDLNRAQRLLVEYNQKTQAGNPEALRLLGYLSLQVGQPGTAREQFTRLLELQPGAIYASMALAQIDVLEQKYPDAITRLQGVLDLDPGNEAAQRQLEAAIVLRDGKSSDPIVDVLVRANRAQQGDATTLGSDAKAIEILEQGIEANGPEPRLIAALATVRLLANDREGALATLATGEAAHPDHPLLRRIREGVESSGSVDAMIAAINESTASEAAKKIQIYRVYRQHGQVEKAHAALAEAAKLAPEDPAVLEYTFGEALARNDLDEAGRVAARAGAVDLDRADGRTYQARILAAKGQLQEATSLLQQAVEKRTATAPTLRLLAVLQLELGRTPDALNAFERALALNPTDLDTIKLYIKALRQVGQLPQALAIAQRSEPYGRRDREFLDLWLDLEATVGNLGMAVSRREQIRQQRPDDTDNTYALAGLYTRAKRWDTARTLIDEVRAKEDTLRVAELEARWHADQADLRAAHAAFTSYIERVKARGEEPGMVPYLALGRFMIDRGQHDVGLAAMELAAPYQDPKTRPADVLRADSMFLLGRMAEAEALYRSLIEAGADGPEMNIAKRLVDVLLRTKRLKEADELATQVSQKAGDDLPLLAQRSLIAEQLGDARRARALADEAVARYPKDALAFHRRAQLLAADPTLAQDALADLDMALRLNPDFVQSLRLRASLYFTLGRVDDALRDLRAAVEADPSLDDLRVSLLAELIRRGREGEAVTIAESAWRLRPGDARLAVQLGDVFAQAGRWGRAAGFYESAFKQFREAHTASRYLIAILKVEPPMIAQAEAVLKQPDLKVEQTPVLLLARAMLRNLQKRHAEAEIDIAAAFLGSGTDQTQLGRWYESALEIYPEPGKLAEVLAKLRVVDPAQLEWRDFFLGQTLLVNADTRMRGLEALVALAERSKEPAILGPVYRLLSPTLYAAGRFEECAEYTRRGLELSPDDADLNNNLAFVLSQNLKNPREALAYAEKAAALAPARVTVLDTLGSVQIALGQFAEADATLTKALSIAINPADKATVLIRLAQAKLGLGKTAEARSLAAETENLLASDPRLNEARRNELEDLKRKIEGR